MNTGISFGATAFLVALVFATVANTNRVSAAIWPSVAPTAVCAMPIEHLDGQDMNPCGTLP